jgi:hypothetical protein
MSESPSENNRESDLTATKPEGSAADVPPQAPPPAPNNDRVLGLGLVAASFVVALGLSWRAKESVMPKVASTPAPPTSEGLAGFPKAVAPVGLLDRARQLTERDQLVGVALSGVAADGTIDVSLGGGARYVFRSLEGQGAEPPREYGELAARKYCGFQVIALNQAGLGALPDVSDADCKRAIEPLPAPACGLDSVWASAKQQGADTSQPATIEYYRSAAGPAWFFQSGAVTLWLGADCSKRLTAEEGRGAAGKRVPG